MNDYRTYRPDKKEKLYIFIGNFALCQTVGLLFFNCKWAFVISPVSYIFLKKYAVAYMAKRERNRLLFQFRDALYSFSSSFYSGRQLKEAMEEAVPYLNEIYGEGSNMAEELKEMCLAIDIAGADEIELWEDFAIRSGLDDIYDFSTVFKACSKAGGNIIKAADKAAYTIQDRIETEGTIRKMAGRKKLEGRMIGFMPVIVILFMRLSSPGYMDVMYESLSGRMIMAMALGLSIFASILADKMTRIEM